MIVHSVPSPIQPSRVLILGSKGFVASRLGQHLTEGGISTRALSSQDLDLSKPESVATLTAELQPTDALVFVSALTPDRGRDIATMMRNLEMGRHVCEALAAKTCAHVVYISTDAVYDDNANPVRETSPTQPASYHGLMHMVRERMLVETLKPAKVPLAILRPSLLYGLGDTHNGYGPNRFIRTAAADRKIALFGNGEEKRDHVCIEDVSELTRLVLIYRSAGVLNIATGASHSFREVAEHVRSFVGEDVQILPSPRANPVTHRHFDPTAIVAAFPSFRGTPIRDGLYRTVVDTMATR